MHIPAVCLIRGTNSPTKIARAAYPPHQIAEDGGAGACIDAWDENRLTIQAMSQKILGQSCAKPLKSGCLDLREPSFFVFGEITDQVEGGFELAIDHADF